MVRRAVLPVALLAATGAAQTSTNCNPLNSTCSDDAALGTTYNETFTASTTELNPDLWNVTAGTEDIQFTSEGAELVISKSGDSVTAESAFYIFWGTVEIIMKAANGTGIISTFDLLSDDLDEIDVEIMGGNTTAIETNWYGWGNTSQYNSKYLAVDGSQESFHNYTIAWSSTGLQWYIDGQVGRDLPYARPGQYPQTPSRLKFGIWAGGDSTEPEGTREWAGGDTDWSQGPFTMTIQSIKITDGTTNASTYAYRDMTGDYTSINTTTGESEAYKVINKESTSDKLKKHWSGLSSGAKIGIACGVVGGLALGALAFFVFFCVQRQEGAKMARLENNEWEANQAELMEYKKQMAKGQFAVSSMGHGSRY
ncbi:concanavalin A-like lectin/glucanase [Teratosphaeria nubilosa]|uniref:chitinase n=1 Tax=Teratosphaeria nubilosa TaxID=161662 RepID=A0A6G1L7W9_9PEZI|nr:concanavalin A-like lectin/glucanase [Teratosphaeria nubilosa]